MTSFTREVLQHEGDMSGMFPVFCQANLKERHQTNIMMSWFPPCTGLQSDTFGRRSRNSKSSPQIIPLHPRNTVVIFQVACLLFGRLVCWCVGWSVGWVDLALFCVSVSFYI